DRSRRRLIRLKGFLRWQRDHIGVDPDEAVAGKRLHGLAVELCKRSLARRDEPERGRAALAKGAFEAGLLAQRLVASSARRARRRERARAAARNAREADRGTEVHQRLRGGGRKLVLGALAHAAHVRILR